MLLIRCSRLASNSLYFMLSFSNAWLLNTGTLCLCSVHYLQCKLHWHILSCDTCCYTHHVQPNDWCHTCSRTVWKRLQWLQRQIECEHYDRGGYIHKRIVRTVFECTEHHQTIATFWSRRTFFRHTVLDTPYEFHQCHHTNCHVLLASKCLFRYVGLTWLHNTTRPYWSSLLWVVTKWSLEIDHMP